MVGYAREAPHEHSALGVPGDHILSLQAEERNQVGHWRGVALYSDRCGVPGELGEGQSPVTVTLQEPRRSRLPRYQDKRAER